MSQSSVRSLAAMAVCLLTCGCVTSPGAPTASQKVELPAPPPVGEPTGIAGLQAAQLRSTFGTPAFIRQDGTAQLWRYDSAACKAFFFLYPDGNSLSVRHVETLPRGQDIAADASCLGALRARGAGPVS
jgi:hypothetical protein